MWGLTIPLTKIAVSTGYLQFGLIFWELIIMIIVLGCIMLVRGTKIRFGRQYLALFLVISLMGSLVPNYFSYQAAAELPAGVLALIISMVPMWALPIAVLLGLDRFTVMRSFGLFCGLAAIVVLVGPEASLPDPDAWPFIILAMISPVCYAIEGNYVSKFGTQDIDPVQTIFGASVLGVVLITPLLWQSGHWIDPTHVWGAPEYSLVGLSLLHVFAYVGYVWLVGRAGSVFAAQVAYLVTGFGVLWSIILLSESYSTWVWAALVLMVIGVVLVQPKGTEEA
jgi:drug/metabolite transporter (DMT)-like permease